MNFGLPYMGGKSKIAKYIINKLPPAKNLYDLFGGGFSITHCAIAHFSHKWEKFYFNEIKQGQTKFIQDCIDGKYSYKNFKPKWVNREEFFKSNDPYVKIVWSFGNNQTRYLFSEENERLKKSLHNAVVFNEFDDFAKKYIGTDKFYFDDIKKRRLALKKIDKSLRLEQLERLEGLEKLKNKIHFSELSYDQVEIKPDSIIYCDPPYKGTGKYSKLGFEHDKFFNWVRDNKNPVFFSEYQAPKDFKLLMVLAHRATLAQNANNQVVEKLFCNESAFDMLKK